MWRDCLAQHVATVRTCESSEGLRNAGSTEDAAQALRNRHFQNDSSARAFANVRASGRGGSIRAVNNQLSPLCLLAKVSGGDDTGVCTSFLRPTLLFASEARANRSYSRTNPEDKDQINKPKATKM